MPYLLARHKVRDYAQWKAVFDEHAPRRKELGSHGGIVLRNAREPDEILVLTEWDDLDGARRFAEWGDPIEIRTRAGLTDRADVWFLEKVTDVDA
jgi:heme-degrading monooxygenase HmoA